MTWFISSTATSNGGRPGCMSSFQRAQKIGHARVWSSAPSLANRYRDILDWMGMGIETGYCMSGVMENLERTASLAAAIW